MANECSFTLSYLNKSSWNREQTKSATKSANRISEKSNIHLPTVFCYAFISGKDRFWILDWMRIFTHFSVLKLISMEALWCQSFGNKQQNCGDEHSTEQKYDQTDDYQTQFSLGNYLTMKRHETIIFEFDFSPVRVPRFWAVFSVCSNCSIQTDWCCFWCCNKGRAICSYKALRAIVCFVKFVGRRQGH